MYLKSTKNNWEFKFLMLVTIVLLCHIMRNIHQVYYLFLGLIHLLNLCFILSYIKNTKLNSLSFHVMLFFIYSFLILIITSVNYGISNALFAFVRFNFVLFFFPMLTAGLTSLKRVIFFYKAISFYILVSLLFIPIQWYFGPISFFADPGERAGIIRYSTNIGSLTVSGVAAIVSIIVFIYTTISIKRILFVALAILLGLMTLQKAFIGGFVVFVIFSLGLIKKENIPTTIYNVLIILLLFFVLISFLSNSIPELESVKIYFENQLTIDGDRSKTADFSISDSAMSRVFGDLVTQTLIWLYEYKGFLGFLFGGDYGMLGPALLPGEDISKYYTSHNLYIDFILVGGVLFLFIFLKICKLTYENIRKLRDNKNSKNLILYRLLLTLFIVILFIGVFGGGFTFQPVIGLVFWSIVAISNNIKNLKFNE